MPCSMSAAPFAGHDTGFCIKAVNGVQQPLGSVQALPVLLPVQVNQQGGQAFEQVQLDRFVVDEGA